MADLWNLLHMTPETTNTGVKITVSTYQPCHLWMRWTTTLPQEHLIGVRRRGVIFRSDKYFCFDNFTDNEQEEAGDTYDHTFIKEPWAFCETRWFYFYGEIGGVPSPSTSPIFKKHRCEDTITYEPLLIDGETQDRCSEAYNCDPTIYYQVHNTPYGWGGPDYIMHLNHYLYNGLFHIFRGVLIFDTSTIPQTDQILSAKVSPCWYGDLGGGYRYLDYPVDLVIVNGGGLDIGEDWQNGNDENVNYNYLRNQTTSLGSIRCPDPMPFGVRFDVPLNDSGIASIVKGGTTKFGVRTSRDIEAIEPTIDQYFNEGGKEDIPIWATDSFWYEYRPELTITFKRMS